MQYAQVVLPMGIHLDENGKVVAESKVTRAPYMSDKQAFGFDKQTYIEYRLLDYDGGQSSESGEKLWAARILRTRQVQPSGNPHDWRVVNGHPFETEMRLFVNEKGDVYRSWKGKLAGRPVCNLETGEVFKYVRPKKVNV